MIKQLPHTLLCTVGTSLFYPNMKDLPTEEGYEQWLANQPEKDRSVLAFSTIAKLREAHQMCNWESLATILNHLPTSVRLNGAEINSISDLLERNYCRTDCRIVLLHSATPDGLQTGTILEHYYQQRGHAVELRKIVDLQDSDPKRFRTKGLRNLVKEISAVVRNQGAEYCAINATGGYKAQIAISTLIGQAMGIAVYYKHERFSEIIAFPPMPISLDFRLWLQCNGWLAVLDRQDMVLWTSVEEDWSEAMETLVDRVEIDGAQFLELTPTGQIFYETFKDRFQSDRDAVLPSVVPPQQKRAPILTDHNWGNAREAILLWMKQIIDKSSYVQGCRTHYWNPGLSSATLFRLKGEEIEAVFSNGSWTVKFFVDTSAKTVGQREACLADLNISFLN
jgi:putative CRISPR-associated protein (TIGR02619 family)